MTESDKCHYKVLGVEINATDEEIRTAYQKLALQSHGKNLGRTMEAKTELQALQQSYKTLSNARKRAKYYEQRTTRLQGQNKTLYSSGAPPTTPIGNRNRSSTGSYYSFASDPHGCGLDWYTYGACSYDPYEHESKLQDFPSAPKKPKTENTYVSTGAIKPIKDLNPNTNQVTVRARVTNKTEVITWSNPRGEGKLFKIDLLDESGEIRMTGFNDLVDSFYDMIQVNHVYYISCFSVKEANKQFTSIKHDFELTFNYETRVTLREGHIRYP